MIAGYGEAGSCHGPVLKNGVGWSESWLGLVTPQVLPECPPKGRTHLRVPPSPLDAVRDQVELKWPMGCKESTKSAPKSVTVVSNCGMYTCDILQMTDSWHGIFLTGVLRKASTMA